MCSRKVSDTANIRIHERTQYVSAEEKILCRAPASQRSHVGNLRQTKKQKEVGVKRVETLVSTLLPRRGARRIPALRRAQLPAWLKRKTPRPLGANTPTAVRVPRSAGAEKGCRPSGANPLTQFAHPAQPVQKRSRPERVNRLRGSGPPFTLCRETKKTPFIKRL